MLALQRTAGNASALALLRRTNNVADDPPISLSLPGVVDDAAVSSLGMGPSDGKGGTTSVSIIRPTDANSLPLIRAAQTAWPDDATGMLMMRRWTPHGWVRGLTLSMERCTVASYAQNDDGYEYVSFHFSQAHIDQQGGRS
jgi:hypothetical protein